MPRRSKPRGPDGQSIVLIVPISKSSSIKLIFPMLGPNCWPPLLYPAKRKRSVMVMTLTLSSFGQRTPVARRNFPVDSVPETDEPRCPRNGRERPPRSMRCSAATAATLDKAEGAALPYAATGRRSVGWKTRKPSSTASASCPAGGWGGACPRRGRGKMEDPPFKVACGPSDVGSGTQVRRKSFYKFFH